MTAGYRIFLLVVEEMSISRAAQKAYVTQQCVSDHIRRLEEEFGVKLFERKPRLTLTPAGEAVYRTVQQVKILEDGMRKNLDEIRTDVRGYFSVGLNATRARILLPNVLPKFHTLLPQVRVSAILAETLSLQDQLLKGEIDLFVGVNVGQNPLFRIQPLAMEEVFLLIGRELATTHFTDTPQTADWTKNGVDLRDFVHVPFVRNLRESTTTTLLNRHCDALNLTLNTLYSVSDYDIQIDLCGMNLAAAFCPAMPLEQVRRHNETASERERIAVFPIKGLTEKLRVDLVTHQNGLNPQYIETFIELVRDYCAG